jgi:arginine-tRNA-protein transferase
VAVLLKRFVEPERPCSYLPTATASLEYRVLVDVTPAELEALLERGWRRFGPGYFRPACSPCGECVSLRIPVAAFRASRSQRRVARKGARLRVVMGPVVTDESRVALHALWYAERERSRSWEPSPFGEDDYAEQFGFPHPCAREVAYYDGSRLVGVGLCDETARAWSASYFFYDPAYAAYSPGVLHLVTLVRMAREQGKAHVYLGFRVQGCVSMRYKAQYRPHELLAGRPALGDQPRWRWIDAARP